MPDLIEWKNQEINKMKRDMFYKFIPEIAGALSNVTKANRDVLVKKLEKLVLTKLKLEKPEIEKEKDLKKKKVKKERIKKFKEEVLGEGEGEEGEG